MKDTYTSSGVNYQVLDTVKKLAQTEGTKTAKNIPGNFKEVPGIRGESAYVIESSKCYYATVIEGLGTKNLIADEYAASSGKTYYASIAQDTVAMIVNDLITVGARPLVISAYWATGNSGFWHNTKRAKDLINGWKRSCDLCLCSWGGGETPTLTGIVSDDSIELAGSCFGIVEPKNLLLTENKILPGDTIVFLNSNGVHANGLTLVRKLAKNLKKGYQEILSNGKTFGEELLKPTYLYSQYIQELFTQKLEIHYLVNITGHGLRKLMRPRKELTYRISKLPKPSPLFQFIQKKAAASDRDMYATFNMGVGFAMYLPQKSAKKAIAQAAKFGFTAWIGGTIEKGEKKVILEERNIEYGTKDLNIR